MLRGVVLLCLLVTPAAAELTAAPIGDAIFPSAIDPKYINEEPARARLHTCVDQYANNKSTKANGGLKWIQRGGGYYSECAKRLTGISSGPTPTQDRGEKLERYTPDECAGIEKMLNQCTKPIGPGWKMCSHMVPGNGSYFWLLEDKYRNEWGSELNCRENDAGKATCDVGPAVQQMWDLCREVCNHNITPIDALQKYCPRPNP